MLLKYWQAFAAHTEVSVVEEGDRIGVRLMIPTEASPYDRKTYPGSDLVAFVRADTGSLARQLLVDVPRHRAIIFKLVDPTDIDAVRSELPVQRQTSFISFTSDRSSPHWQPQADVAIATTPSPVVLPLYATQGYDADEVADYAAHRQGRFYTIGGDALQGACFSFCNYGPIHEIGGLHTLPEARRRGVARRLVETALATLHQHQLVPRYQVHEDNLPSIALAQAIGLRPAVTAEHWLHAP